jgi:ATP-dependent DNA helicase
MRLIEAVKAIPATELSGFRLVAVLQVLPEADRTYTPIGLRKTRKESARISDAAGFFGTTIVQALQRWVSDEHSFWARCKRAAILADWMNGTPIRNIEDRYSVPFGGDVRLGDIQRFADAARFHFRSAHKILSALLTITAENEEEFQRVAKQLEFGVPADLAELMETPIALSRGECLAFASRGIRSRAALFTLPPEALLDVLGARRAHELTSTLARLKEV